MDLSKTKSLLVVIEGFVVQIATHWISLKHLPQRLVEFNPDLPWITVGMVSATISPLVAITYMCIRLQLIPKMITESKIFRSSAIGIILAWLVVFTQVLFLGKGDPFTLDILQTRSQPAYFHLTLLLLVIWGPLLEEALNRGYFFETLRMNWGTAVALPISSFLFVSFHGIFMTIYYGGIGYEMIFITLYSIIFTAVYMRGGLFAAFVTHMFVNSCLLYLNTETGIGGIRVTH